MGIDNLPLPDSVAPLDARALQDRLSRGDTVFELELGPNNCVASLHALTSD